jgi:hypothetical protein
MRYFTDDQNTVWRYDGMEMRVRTSNGWSPSLFKSPSDLSRCLNNIREIPEP